MIKLAVRYEAILVIALINEWLLHLNHALVADQEDQ
jgi:hypothetical protein